jgi:Family of unknown function (DUF6317)
MHRDVVTEHLQPQCFFTSSEIGVGASSLRHRESPLDHGGEPVSEGGFEVVMSDLQGAASTFDAESTTLRGLIPADGPPCPDGGSGEIDGAMHAVLSKVGTLNQSLAEAMAAHAQKLARAHANYVHTELTLTQLSQDLAAALAPGGRRR